MAILDPELLRDDPEHVVLRNDARGDQHVKRGLIAFAHGISRCGDLLCGQEALLPQKRQYVFVIRSHCCEVIYQIALSSATHTGGSW